MTEGEWVEVKRLNHPCAPPNYEVRTNVEAGIGAVWKCPGCGELWELCKPVMTLYDSPQYWFWWNPRTHLKYRDWATKSREDTKTWEEPPTTKQQRRWFR